MSDEGSAVRVRAPAAPVRFAADGVFVDAFGAFVGAFAGTFVAVFVDAFAGVFVDVFVDAFVDAFAGALVDAFAGAFVSAAAGSVRFDFVRRAFDSPPCAAAASPLRAARVAPGIVVSVVVGRAFTMALHRFCTAQWFCQREAIQTSVAIRPHAPSRR